eukprot:CAMPEP_0170390296 /NCGR_PEP_ID=MMETSP0117_2-20130122/19070_1 /TAXON_ID=400756 /ORGANISM="Durinskia baltica, Strain CSIRO CS-38" /LENGTH=124 /DNA_ID=CAMNT_0010646331 /DNA_START=40 /DNA_END=414 /DNA_ORIENTATION=+
MSWFGFGGSSDNGSSGSKIESSMKIDDFDASQAAQFDNTPSYASPSSGGGMMGGGSFEQQIMMEQQKAVVQAVMLKLTESSFDACITKPSSSMSSSERSCIGAVVSKYLDASELVVGRMQSGQR